jgi:cysteine desulfurase / selenocysteine lyase
MTSYNLPLYRSWFPFLSTGTIWLNHAAISPLSTRVNDAMAQFLAGRTMGKIDTFLSTLPLVADARLNLGRLINATPDRIAFVMNTSDGLNVLATGLTWKMGDRILLNDNEFPSNVVPFINLRRFGVEVDILPTINGRVTAETLEQHLTPKTRLVSLSFVQFLSGFRADLVAIGALCKRRGIIFCVDAIQGLGACPLDVRAMNIDFLACGGTKWLMACMGLGFIFTTQELQERLHQSSMGWTSNKDYFSNFFQYRIDPDLTARRYENGTQNYLGITALQASTSVLLEVGIAGIQAHLFTLTDTLIEIVDSMDYELITPREREHRAGIVTFRAPNADDLFNFLHEQGIVVSLREGLIRVAPHFYTSAEDIEKFHAALLQYKQQPSP